MDSFFLPLLKSVHLQKNRNGLIVIEWTYNGIFVDSIKYFLIYTSIFQMINKVLKQF